MDDPRPDLRIIEQRFRKIDSFFSAQKVTGSTQRTTGIPPEMLRVKPTEFFFLPVLQRKIFIIIHKNILSFRLLKRQKNECKVLPRIQNASKNRTENEENKYFYTLLFLFLCYIKEQNPETGGL